MNERTTMSGNRIIQNNIGWCDETTNAVTGCDKVSPGCKNCYAAVGTRARVLRAQGKETWGPKGIREPVNFEQVFRRLNKLCVCDKCHATYCFSEVGQSCRANISIPPSIPWLCNGTLRRIRLFADSNSDWLDKKWPIETLAKFLNAIRLAPNINVQLLTKRTENWEKKILAVAKYDEDYHDITATADFHTWIVDWLTGTKAPSNIWLGASVENQKCADERIPQLLKVPAAVRFLSCEPLLESVNLGEALDPCAKDCRRETVGAPPLHGHWHKGLDKPLLHWVIVGLESGKDRRDPGIEPLLNIVEQCKAAGVPVYVKQDSGLISGVKGRIPNDIWRLKQFPEITRRVDQSKTAK